MKKCRIKSMSRYIETIKLTGGTLLNLEYHQQRFERTRRDRLALVRHPRLEDLIRIPDSLVEGDYKCRVIYGSELERIEYTPALPRKIRSLRVVYSETIEYGYKSTDRELLDYLHQMRGTCDDVLIVKNGLITDSHSANIVLWDGQRWLTPDTPLLEGTMRASLLAAGRIHLCRIYLNELQRFHGIRLINALSGLEDSDSIPVEAVSIP